MRAVRAALLLVAVAAVAGATYWVVRAALAPPAGDVGDGPAEDAEPEADLAPGERFERVGSVERDVFETFPGTVAAERPTPVRALQGMRVAVVEIVKDQGDFVKKGDVLVRFHREEIERAIEKAVREGDRESEARFRRYLEHADLRSEVDGIVSDVWTEVGRVPVDEGIPLLTITSREGFTLRVQVPAGLTKTVANIGARLAADLEANLGRAEGTVAAHEPAPEGWIVVVVGLDPKEGLEPDHKASLRVPTSKQEVALVPRAAVTQRGDVKVVRVWEPSDAGPGGSVGERTILTDGERGDAWIAVAGVFPGEHVVVPARGR